MTATKLKEKPILFSTPMVLAILQGRKFQTRRQIKLPNWATSWDDFETDGKIAQIICEKTGCLGNITCPYDADVLWVRETWRQSDNGYAYFADALGQVETNRWKPSIHMPRAACRITLQITDIRVEQLQSISQQDAIAEGIEPREDVYDKDYEDWIPTWCNYEMPDGQKLWYYDPIKSFQSLWTSINGKESWSANPWVWILEFKLKHSGKD